MVGWQVSLSITLSVRHLAEHCRCAGPTAAAEQSDPRSASLQRRVTDIDLSDMETHALRVLADGVNEHVSRANGAAPQAALLSASEQDLHDILYPYGLVYS